MSRILLFTVLIFTLNSTPARADLVFPEIAGTGIEMPPPTHVAMAGVALSAAMVGFGLLLTRKRSPATRRKVALTGLILMLGATIAFTIWSVMEHGTLF